MPLRHPRLPRAAIARGTALSLFASVAWLAAAPPAAGQRSDQERSPEAPPEYRYASFKIELPRVLNTDVISPQLAALFPPAMREKRISSGSASLRFRVLADSTVDSASITVEGSSNPAFVEPATAIAPRMRFAPVSLDGRTVPAWVRFDVDFLDPADTSGQYALGPVDEQPTLRNREEVARHIMALYPRALRDSGVSGAVIMRFRISAEGTAEPTTIKGAVVTDLAFEEPGRAVVRRMRFTPARLGGRPVPITVSIPIQFIMPTPPPVEGGPSGNARSPR